MNLRNILLAPTLALTIGMTAAGTLEEQFASPGFESRPWTFWYWMFGAVSDEGIKADLEAMAQAGLGGTYLMPIKSDVEGPQYSGKAQQLSPEWWRLVTRSMELADSLGLKLGMHICDGFALAGGPWITPAESMQKVVTADTVVTGGSSVYLSQLPVPQSNEGYYRDIALVAVPVKGLPIDITPVITVGNDDPAVTGNQGISIDEGGTIRSSVPSWFQYDYGKPVTACNMILQPSGTNHQAHRLLISASDDGKTFHEVKQIVPARQGWQDTDASYTYTFPRTTARYFRFHWTPDGTEPGSEDLDAAKWKPNLKVKKVSLSDDPKIDNWEGKSAVVWRVAPATPSGNVTDVMCVDKDSVIDLSYLLSSGKEAAASLPDGEWKVIRIGHTSTGHVNATAGAGKGLECDKFSRDAVRKQIDNWYGRMFRDSDPDLARKVLKYMHVDSWECGSQNWSDNFAEEFRKRRGYDLTPYLILYAGIPVDNVATSEKVLRDIRTTAAELVVDVFYDVLAEKADAYDVTLSAECVSPTMVSDGMAHYSMVDIPMGEFWLRSPTHDKPNDMLDAIHGAHIYGKPIIQAEGFTEVRGTWDETPAMLKTLLDRNYALGINRLFFHVTAHNPWLDKKPGMTLDGIGLFFQRNNTWWRDGARGLSDYAARCQQLLQYGVPVIDIAVFNGEEIPRRAILPDRLVSTLPGIFGAERVESEQIRLANDGQPLRVMPVGVTHSANMADPEKWINPLRGYNYDTMNKDALLRLASGSDGRITLPGGASYGVLVLPHSGKLMTDVPYSKEVLEKIAELRKAGVVIPETPYKEEDFSKYGIERDIIVPDNIAWTHRRNSTDNVDIYFLSNQEEMPRDIKASFRVAGREPELWDPLTGRISAAEWKSDGKRTEVNIPMQSAGSVFVVFRQPTVEASGSARAVNFVDKEFKTSGKWKMHFETTGREIITPELFDWTSSEDDDIRYYSGTVNYTVDFKVPDYRKGDRVILNLEGLHDVASVKVNGKECGIVWTAPWSVDVTDALHKGKNQLSVDVSNTWANALLGADEGKAPFDGIWTNGKYRRAEKETIPAGLTGPLTFTIESHSK